MPYDRAGRPCRSWYRWPGRNPASLRAGQPATVESALIQGVCWDARLRRWVGCAGGKRSGESVRLCCTPPCRARGACRASRPDLGLGRADGSGKANDLMARQGTPGSRGSRAVRIGGRSTQCWPGPGPGSRP